MGRPILAMQYLGACAWAIYSAFTGQRLDIVIAVLSIHTAITVLLALIIPTKDPHHDQ
jgi:hypothetical protein